MTIHEAVRAAFKTFENPDAADRQRVLVIARAKLAQSGNTKDEVKVHNVTQVRCQIRAALGKFTREAIEEYERKRLKAARALPAPSAARVTAPAAEITLSQLKAGRDFVAAAGGFDAALAVLQALKEIRS